MALPEDVREADPGLSLSVTRTLLHMQQGTQQYSLVCTRCARHNALWVSCLCL